jgi:Asp-tRNA(Asn)/Glu-tRNA(Gln) amidotransferase A subunit family amidase
MTVTLGWVGLTNKPAKRDSGTTTMLKRLGAVLYIKTNIPQSLMVIVYPSDRIEIRTLNYHMTDV